MQQLLDDRYELRSLRGSGGMATVFEGYDRALDRRVAVKFLQASRADGLARQRFEREARAAASLMHPNAVAVYDVGEDGSNVFIVMELVEGPTLAERIRREGPLPVGDAVSITDQLLAVLDAAHDQGIVHRDVKPGNVLLTPDGTAKLVDFGIAKAFGDASPDLTATGEVLGTPRYLSPEQAAGHGATPQSDLYAVGVILYEMLAGEPPFTGPSATAVALAHQRERVPPLSKRRPDLSPALIAVVDRALAKDPSRRFASAAQMRAALHGDTADVTLPVAAVEPTQTYRRRPASRGRTAAPRPSRRRWVLALLGALLAAALVAFLATGLAGSNDRSPLQAALSTPSTAATTTSSTTTTTVAPRPTSIADLLALLAADPSAFGIRGQELYNQLLALQNHPDRKGRAAADLITRVEQWAQRGQLDPTIAAETTQVLMSSAPVQSGPGDGGD
jgi:serine/threonine protein kinase